MRKKVFPLVIFTLFLAVALPAFANSTVLTFSQAQDTTVTSQEYTFTGSISTTQNPGDLTYRYLVYTGNTDTLIDSSGRTTTLSGNEWNYANGVYTGTFSFTAKFGLHRGPMTVYIEAWKDNVRVASRSLRVNVSPVQVTLDGNQTTFLTGRSHELTGTITSYTDNLTFSYSVEDNKGNVIDRSRSASPVVITRVRISSELYSYTAKFNVNYGDYTGVASVTLTATAGSREFSDTIAVVVERESRVTPTFTGDFKNRGQLVSYISQQLKREGHGKHKNHGQALKFALKHQDFAGIRTQSEANSFIRDKVLK